MAKRKRVALIISASNFERQKNIIYAVHRKLKEIGNCCLYVFSSYGLFVGNIPNEKGEESIYSLINKKEFDGCILEGNIGNSQMLQQFADVLKERKIPFVVMNYRIEGAPFVSFDSYKATYELLEHLITVHNCQKINMVADIGNEVITQRILKAYQDVTQKYGYMAERRRVVNQLVSVNNGRALVDMFKKQGIEDAQAVLCSHDIHAIGLCMELEERGFRVPDDIKICSLNRSTNSVIFRPEISGTDRMDDELSEKTCQILIDMIEGKPTETENYLFGDTYYAHSCGCSNGQGEGSDKRYQDVVLAKVEAGNQIRNMMQYNDSLEKVTSLDELGENIKNMLIGINCSEFVCCLNQRDLKYIMNEEDTVQNYDEVPFDEDMIALKGITKRGGEIQDKVFALEQLLPVEEEDGDLFIFLPIRHKDHAFGYMVFINEYLPIDIYNYRICHESIGSSIEGLHRQMVLKSTIQQLNELHMTDALTGLYNRFALNNFRDIYEEKKVFSMIMFDMDGLKPINDNYGHLSGNHAICIIANTIAEAAKEGDLVMRYGGDEFLIISHDTNKNYWEEQKGIINEKLQKIAEKKKLPYSLGVSLGYAESNVENSLSMDECYIKADEAMYQHKKERKIGRK